MRFKICFDFSSSNRRASFNSAAECEMLLLLLLLLLLLELELLELLEVSLRNLPGGGGAFVNARLVIVAKGFRRFSSGIGTNDTSNDVSIPVRTAG